VTILLSLCFVSVFSVPNLVTSDCCSSCTQTRTTISAETPNTLKNTVITSLLAGDSLTTLLGTKLKFAPVHYFKILGEVLQDLQQKTNEGMFHCGGVAGDGNVDSSFSDSTYQAFMQGFK